MSKIKKIFGGGGKPPPAPVMPPLPKYEPPPAPKPPPEMPDPNQDAIKKKKEKDMAMRSKGGRSGTVYDEETLG